MALNIPCPYCGRVVSLPDDYLGAGVRCPECAVVFAVQQTALTADAPPPPPAGAWREFPEKIKVRERPLERPRRYEPGRGSLLVALGVASLAVSVLGMVAGAFVGGTPVLFAPPAFGLGLAAWVMGQRDMEKIRRAVIDPYADRLTRGGWVAGIVGTFLGVVMLLCGMCGLYAQMVKQAGNGG